MAMLAEPRRKQKYSVDPRGTNWSNDDSKFGQKLLEKFGWKKGKGLGAKEDGKTEHVKVSVKSDHKGVGCTKNQADNWIAHQDDFNELLANLNQSGTENGNNDNEDKVSSLEARSKTSRARVHYQKFTKGKDLSAKSLQDLDCVFGVRKTRSEPSTPQCQSEENSDCDDGQDENKEKITESGLKTIKSADSVQEYFAKKMAELKRSRSNQSGAVEDTSCENSNQRNDGKTDKIPKKVTFSIDSSSSSENDEENRKTKKTKKRKAKDSNGDSDESETVTKKSKKKKQNEPDDVIKQIEEENSQIDRSDKKSKKKKDKKDKSKVEKERSEEQDDKIVHSPESESEQNIDTPTEECTDTVISKKKKNKKKKKKVKDNESDDDDLIHASSSSKSKSCDVKENKKGSPERNQDEGENKESEETVSIKKKKSKKRKKNSDDRESNVKSCDKSGNLYVDNSDSVCGEPGCKRKKKSKDNDAKEKNTNKSKDDTEISTDKNVNSSENCLPEKKFEDSGNFEWNKKRRTKTCEKVQEKFEKKGSNVSSIRGYNLNNTTGLMKM